MQYEPHIPKELLESAGPRTGKMDINNTQGHFALVNYQLKEVKHWQMGRGWAISIARTISTTRMFHDIS